MKQHGPARSTANRGPTITIQTPAMSHPLPNSKPHSTTPSVCEFVFIVQTSGVVGFGREWGKIIGEMGDKIVE